MKTKPKSAKLEKQNLPTKNKTSRKSEIIDEDYLDYVRSLRCCVPGCNNYAIPHHIKSRKLVRNDHKVINVCKHHHVTGGIKDAIHQMGKVSWSKKFGINLESHAESLYKNYLKTELTR